MLSYAQETDEWASFKVNQLHYLLLYKLVYFQTGVPGFLQSVFFLLPHWQKKKMIKATTL